MNILSRIKILPKILSVIVMLGSLIGVGVWYAASQMRSIDDAYTSFIDNEASAASTLRRINRTIFELNYSVYRTIAETDESQMKAANARFEAAVTPLRQYLKTARSQAGSFAGRVDALVPVIERYLTEVTEIRRLASLNRNAEAVEMVHQRIDPTFDAMVAEGTKLANDMMEFVVSKSAELTDDTNRTRQTLFVMSLLGVLGAVGAGVFVAMFGITRPMAKLVAVLEQMAQGRTEVELVEARRGDEIGAMGRAVDAIKAMVARKAAEEAEVKQIADAAAADERKRTMLELADGFERSVGGIVHTLSDSSNELQTTAQSMTASATQAAAQSHAVASAAEEAASNVQKVAAAAEELGSSVQEIGRQVSSSAELARNAVGEAEQTAHLVNALSESAARIGDVVGLISSIASQTNLLALNATIEAARAGEAGRGFAVVASEVKELAAQTTRATDEISSQIAQIQGATGQAVTAIGAISTRIREISSVATTIAAAVEEQGAATQEIVRNVSQAAVGTTEVTTNISGVASASEQTGAASGELLTAATELSRQSERLGMEMSRFLGTVRAA